ncbi:hypothetical protein MTR_3g466540 [Medicago truncatula]|uniref:Transmembrane protein n=1 Tax=Medicago truncatula TaxID=3880 RepID=A0A072UXC3_MEDTR|nr:hypothetical protein MTR_3g466540 [Medicago truncatula]
MCVRGSRIWLLRFIVAFVTNLHEHGIWASNGDDENGTLGVCKEAWFKTPAGNR